MVRAIARAHGGDVALLARVEGGLEVTVTLPAATRIGRPAGTQPPVAVP